MRRFVGNVAFGTFLGCELVLVFVLVLDLPVAEQVKEHAVTIFGASITLLAAAFALLGVLATIEHQNDLEVQRRNKKFEAARAFLPNCLSRLCELSRRGMLYSHEFAERREQLGEEEFRRQSVNELTLPADIVSVLREVVEYSENSALSKRVAAILREHQIFFARWQGEFARAGRHIIRNESHEKERIVGWAFLYALSASLFEFARSEKNEISDSISEIEISTALRVAGPLAIYENDFQAEIRIYAKSSITRPH